ncbi:MAG: hypothetical protein ACJ790_01630 [Myxococcaceae bacterium]
MQTTEQVVKNAARMQPVNKPGAQDVWKTRAAWFTENRAALGMILLCFLGLSIGWDLFAERMGDRTERADAAGGDVARIWGGPLVQPHPTVRWRRADAATVDVATGELSSTSVIVDLDAEYRRKGLTEYPGYEAAFKGDYAFKNPSTEASFVAFTVGLPTERDALMLRDVRLLVDGVEDPEHTEYAPQRIIWTGQVRGSQTAKFELAFRARGMTTFGYTFAPTRSGQDSAASKPVTAFDLVMRVKGVPGEIDFPVGTMTPTADDQAGNVRTLSWKVDRLLTSFDVGIKLPDNRGVTVAMEKLTRKAPVFYLMFGVGLLWALASVRRRARALHVLALSGAYFLFFPLATYLTAYLAWPVACAISLVGIGSLCIVHGVRFVNRNAGARIAACTGFFLAVPTIAHLIPAHTGIILIVGGFVACGIAMHVIGLAARQVKEREEQAELPDGVPAIVPTAAGVAP